MRRLTVLLASAVMALSLIAFAVATGASAAPKQFYGTIYESPNTPNLYWGAGTSKASANQEGYDLCVQDGGTECGNLVWVRNGWAAVYQGTAPNGDLVLGSGYGRTEQEASTKAQTNCQAGGTTGCKLVGAEKTALDTKQKTTGGYQLPNP